MEITGDFFNGKELPNYVFKHKYNHYFFLDHDLMHSGNSYILFKKLLIHIVERHQDNYILISKLKTTRFNEQSINMFLRAENIELDLEWLISYSISLNSEIFLNGFGLPYSNPTIICPDSGKWAIYYKYEDETILVATQESLNFEPQIFENLFLYIEGENATYHESEDSDFLKKLIMNYSPYAVK